MLRLELDLPPAEGGPQPTAGAPAGAPAERGSGWLARVLGRGLASAGSPRRPHLPGRVTFDVVELPPGTFLMGSDRTPPIHEVTLTRPAHLGVHPVTQAQWEAVMGGNPSRFRHPDRPVESVSWDDCQAFLARLNSAGRGSFRLPTEAEWEYACRAGARTEFCFGDDEAGLGEFGWYSANSGGETRPVATRRANAWGLHDVHGNVWEWCQDWWDEYPPGPAVDPAGPPQGFMGARVFRGGCWRGEASFAACAHRGGRGAAYRAPIIGLRIAWTAEP